MPMVQLIVPEHRDLLECQSFQLAVGGIAADGCVFNGHVFQKALQLQVDFSVGLKLPASRSQSRSSRRYGTSSARSPTW